MADELPKLIIHDHWMLQRALFRQLERRRRHASADLFTSNASNQSECFYSLHWCRGSAGVNAFAFY